MASLGPEPRLRGSPRRQPVLSRKQIEDAIEAKRGELMQQAAMVRAVGAWLRVCGWAEEAEGGCVDRPGRLGGGASCSGVVPPCCACRMAMVPPCCALPLTPRACPARQTDEEFEAAKAATAAQLLAAAQQAAAPVLPDHIARGRRLAALLDKALPRDHPHYAAARQRLEVLEVSRTGAARARLLDVRSAPSTQTGAATAACPARRPTRGGPRSARWCLQSGCSSAWRRCEPVAALSTLACPSSTAVQRGRHMVQSRGQKRHGVGSAMLGGAQQQKCCQKCGVSKGYNQLQKGCSAAWMCARWRW